MAGIYIHIPFCEQFCTYCNFYSVKGGTYRDKFIQALKREIEAREDFIKGAATIYFGGGTPSVLTIPQLREILHLVTETFCDPAGKTVSGGKEGLNTEAVLESAEITLEVNPDDITAEYACGLVETGFNRVSMGVQSFIDEHLAWMNRRHRSAGAVQAYRILRSARIKNISLDLIFGYEGLSMEQWEYNLDTLIELSPEHISAYQMSVEPGSRLSAMLRKGEYTLPPDTTCAAQYKMLQQKLSAAGYQQYEVSNFARKGYHSRHNSAYWDKTPYLGLGPAAHSFDGKRRFWNTENLKKYCDHYLKENHPAISTQETLSETDIFNESVMLGLRTVQGVDTAQLSPAMLRKIQPAINREILSGNLLSQNTFLKIPFDKLFISDSIIRELFYLQ